MNRHLAYVSKITNLKENLLRGLEFINWRSQVKKDSIVFIKPNFTFPYYKEGVTTNPEVLQNLLEIIKDRAEHVIVGESDGGNHSFKANEAFKGHNMYQICRKVGVDLVNLSRLPSAFVEEKIQGKKVKVQLPKLLLDNEVNCFISVPVLKVHVITKVSLGIKNLWGCYPDTMRGLFHKKLSYKLALIAKSLPPKLIVIDGTFALDGHGPMFGIAKPLDLLLLSNNLVVADSLGANIMGIPPKSVHHIFIAEKEGLGTTKLQQIKINDSLEHYRLQFHIRKTMIDMASIPLFYSENLAKIVMDSPFKFLIYKLARFLRTSKEQELANEMRGYFL
nr:DUF362 domain-containing protein [Candidatus Borrarchaeum sp.]